MKLLTLLCFQVFVIALLCSSSFAEERAATLDELIRALGSLYQHKLFSVRGEGDELEDLRKMIIGGESVRPTPELRETLKVPRYQYCMEVVPYCVTVYTTITVQDRPLRQSKLEKKKMRNTQDQLCLKDIKLGSCSDAGLVGDYNELVDVSDLEIPDFCFPGEIKLDGELEFFDKITSDATVHVQMNPVNLPKRNSNRYYEPASCSQLGYFYNVCDLLDRSSSCPNPRDEPDDLPIPCTCDIEKGVYSMISFEKTVDKVDFFGMGERSGFAVVSSGGGKSCFSFNFTGTLGDF